VTDAKAFTIHKAALVDAEETRDDWSIAGSHRSR
jgi:hypothetical protein